MVEDVLQASLPGFVDAVRIADVGQGTNPVRIISMRALPDKPGHPDYPREEWVGLDKDPESKKQAQEAEKGDSDDPAKEVDTDQTGDYWVCFWNLCPCLVLTHGHRTTKYLFHIRLFQDSRKNCDSTIFISCWSSLLARGIGSDCLFRSMLLWKVSSQRFVCGCSSSRTRRL